MGSSAAGWAKSSELEGPKHSKIALFDNPAPIIEYVLECVKWQKVSVLHQKPLTFVPVVKVCYKKIWFEGHNHLQFWNEVFRLPTALPQGQLAEVPLYFDIFTIKVGG